APELFVSQFFDAQVFFTTVLPLASRALMQELGECFRQAISERFDHDRIVVVQIAFELFCKILCTNAGSYRKCADVVDEFGFRWRHEIRERATWLVRLFWSLLTQHVQAQ